MTDPAETVEQDTEPDQQAGSQTNPRLLYQAHREHVWIAMAVHRIPEDVLRRAAESGEGYAMDHSNLARIDIGCFICEQPFEVRLTYRDCPGQPKDDRR